MKHLISKSFTFEAAHSLKITKNKANENIHGHSFYVTIWFEGKINKNGIIYDFLEINKLIRIAKKKLDHKYLNDIHGLENPTLENIGSWIWNIFSKKQYTPFELEVSRKSCFESFKIRAD